MFAPSPFPSQLELKKPVCVFCGSSPGKLPLFTNASAAVGQTLAKAGIPLVYGGGRRGIMGVVSQSCLKAGGYVHGIVPRALTERASEHTPVPGSESKSDSKSKEGQGEDVLSESDSYGEKFTTDVVGSMHERKLKMAKISQGGFIVLPGGYGTFEEALEMITWNQLGIHRLPILILNVGNFYTHLYNQFISSVEAGFIAPSNLSLLKLVNLEGGEDANTDESRAEEWGQAAIKALDEWDLAEGAGYALEWELKEKRAGGNESNLDAESSATAMIKPSSSSSQVKMKSPEAIFTTLRYTSSSSSANPPVKKESLPLLDLHFERLREAFDHFSERDGRDRWGDWPSEERIWKRLKEVLEQSQPGDYRVRIVIHPGSEIEVHCVPAPKDAGPFTLLPSPTRPNNRRPVILDPHNTSANSELTEETDLRLYKTVNRDIYDEAYERGQNTTGTSHNEVLLHTPTEILETTTSNIAILLPNSNLHSPKWITPVLSKDTPFLNGVMRRYLLSQGVIEEGQVSIGMIRKVRDEEGGRIIGFNGLRGVWEGELI